MNAPRVLPEEGLPADRVLRILHDLGSKDADPHSGRLWSYVYEHGLPAVREAAERAYIMMLWRNMLDPTVFPSVLELESTVVSIVASLFHAPEGYAGSFTSGGTESNFLAVLAARERFAEVKGRDVVPELVMPVTAHPSLAKAAHILGLRVRPVPVDENYLADVEAVKEAISGRTAMVALSAPNYPTGGIDPVREVAEYASDKGVWLHVDACLGFILPFLEELGVRLPAYDFRVEGVYSVSVDLHKYGYAPRGASVILYRERSLRLGQLFIYSRWPGYPLVNTVFQSSRTAGPLAAAWATLMALGRRGYLELARRVLEAKEALVKGLNTHGFSVLGVSHGPVLAVTHKDLDLVALSAVLLRRGWYVQVQPGSRHLGFPQSLHFTVTPVHKDVVDRFLEDFKEAVEEASKARVPEQVATLVRMLSEAPLEELERLIPELIAGGGGLGDVAELVARVVHEVEPGRLERLFRAVANQLL